MRARSWWTVPGDRGTTREAVCAALVGLPEAAVLWVGEDDVPWPRCRAGRLKRHLGSSRAVVVLDLTEGVDADLIGIAQGLVHGGGTLVLRVDPEGQGSARLAVHPHGREAVGRRLLGRLLRHLPPGPAPRLSGEVPSMEGTAEQTAVVRRLGERIRSREPTATVLLAARGRGKSAALGLALADYPGRVALTAMDAEAVQTVQHFAGSEHAPLADLPEDVDLVVIDEAARVPLPELRRLVLANPRAHLAFATTSEGYEGTGRGFVVRFLAWLRSVRPTELLRLSTPIRWAVGDPLERAVQDLFLLDAGLPDVEADGSVRTEQLSDLQDERVLREVFGLLVHAHYRTTPSDLHRLLDAPNLSVFATFVGAHVGAVCLVAREGGLPAEMVAGMRQGRRIRGHALADTLVCHAGRAEAGGLSMLRSVRIATHPALRRRGLAARLVQAVHDAHPDVDLFGTVFSGDPGVLRFREGLGYRLVRVGSRASARSGAPALVMVRPANGEVEALVSDLRAELARDWPVQRALLEAEGDADVALLEAVDHGLPEPAPLDVAAREQILDEYERGARTYEAAAAAIESLVREATELPELLRLRAVERWGWRRLFAREADPPAVVMRTVRQQVASLRAARRP